MESSPLPPASRRRLLWPGIAFLALLAWTVYCESSWLRHAPHLRAVPAFFLGALILLIVTAAFRLCAGAWRSGWRWLIGREARRLYGWTALFAVSTVALFYNVELWRGKRAWAALVREAKERGEPLDYEALSPPQPPDERNFAKAPLFAPLFEEHARDAVDRPAEFFSPQLREIERVAIPFFCPGTPFAPWLEGRGTSLLEFWMFYFQTNRPPTLTNEIEAAGRILAKLEKQRPILDELRPFSSRPECWFPLWRTLPADFMTRQRNAMNGLSRLLRVRASAELALNRPDTAFEDMLFVLRLADHGRQRPQPSSMAYARHHLVVLDALQPLWDGLAKRCWNAAQVAELQRQLERLDFLGDYPAAVRADALTMATFVELLIPTAGTSRSQPALDIWVDDQSAFRWVRFFYPSGWSLQDQAVIHRFHLETTSRHLDLAARRIAGSPRRDQPPGLFASSDLIFYVFMCPKVQEMFGQACGSFAFVQTAVDLATLACALERYRLANGEFPAALDALVPLFVAKLPHDVITGEPLKYRRTDGGGFVIYSVGFNKVDDGGKPCARQKNWQGQPEPRFDLDHNDWVWICPEASPPK